MKTLCKRLVAAAMTLTLALGLAVPAMAYTTPDFADLPANNWAYAPVMRMADQGIIQGTGGGNFSPELKVSAAQFLTLVGRIVFPEAKVSEGDTWYGPYVAAAQSNGLLTGTQVDVNQPEAEITRYDMAVVLRAAAKKLGKTETLAQQSQVTDFGVIPNMYTEAVLAVYGMELIKGDQAGKFNGGNTMQRNELATVIDRLVALKGSGTTTEPEQPEQPTEPETIHTVLSITCYKPEPYEINSSSGRRTIYSVPVELRYTEDGGKTSQLVAECTSYTQGTYDFVSLEADIDKALVDNENGQFYLSAETTYEGQKLVTYDRRTDGRATIFPIDVEVKSGHDWVNCDLDLVPPTGFKRNVTIRGFVHSNSAKMEAMPNISVDLVLYRDATGTKPSENEMGIVLGSTVSDENGEFLMTVEIDTLDFYINMRKCYRMEAHGNYNEKQWVSESWPFNSLSELTHIVPSGMSLPRVPIQMKPI